ncbi:MAG: HNH endonuclease signature motif containing protein [Chloroflexota bacterium]
MSDIPETVRQYVRERAKNRCEYCLSHQDYVMGRLQIDHVHPLSKDGSNDDDNLCLACELCNQYKWAKTHGLDPESGEFVLLFNPRQQLWAEHFRWAETGVEVIGVTDCGRATITALKLNNTLSITVRRNWVSAGWHPPDD